MYSGGMECVDDHRGSVVLELLTYASDSIPKEDYEIETRKLSHLYWLIIDKKSYLLIR